MKKVELLAPAGNFDALKGAIKAGADAVYLGGALYGARAYADNFSQDEICTGIHLAHVFGRKVYLTVNTLVKEKELDGLYNFLLPLYENGLDGVIIQDLGVLHYIRKHFPGLELHASTQMTLTGVCGTKLLVEQGVSRIVPARELSLAEMKRIKEETGVEIEAFIHGAMCYCYSGQCLFSSILGGRSGNRGRCAQPCRLPYGIDGGEVCYPLSMRDMCTIQLLPELIEAGIDSFKIEGRMKRPAYAAGVTAIYRKYIDLYYNQKETYRVANEDLNALKALYIRSELSDGYYKCHNSREMITLNSPAYSGTDEVLLEQIERKYVYGNLSYPASAKAVLEPGNAAKLTLVTDKVSVTEIGELVQKAVKQPLSSEKIREQIGKSGNSLINIEEIDLDVKDAVFMPVRALNELRRGAAASLEDALIRAEGFDYHRSAIPPQNDYCDLKQSENTAIGRMYSQTSHSTSDLHIVVRTKEQLLAALSEYPARIYLDYSLLNDDVCELLAVYKKDSKACSEFYLATPYIVRDRNKIYLKQIQDAVETGLFKGVLIRNLESYAYFREQYKPDELVLDAGLYLWNREALAFWQGKSTEFYLPVENNLHEWRQLLPYAYACGLAPSAIVYGRLPMMITANCLNKTRGLCRKTPQILSLKDRYGKLFPVYTDCASCYNILYNTVPLSLHKLFEKNDRPFWHYRLDFTTENQNDTQRIIHYFKGLSMQYQAPFYEEYTTGHMKRGVE